MHTLAQKAKAPAMSGEALLTNQLSRVKGREVSRLIPFERSVANQEEHEKKSSEGACPRGNNFCGIPPRSQSTEAERPHARVYPALFEKPANGGNNAIPFVDKDQAGSGSGAKGTNAPAPPAAPKQPAAAPAQKKAGVQSFEVDWSKNSKAGPTVAKLRLDFRAKFQKDATHDPALADFRQNAKGVLKITDGPNKGVSEKEEMHDDNYSRADNDSTSDVEFISNDNPGIKDTFDLKPGDDIDYSFTAEQMIIDKSDGDKVIAKLGPHTATIKGKHPRQYGGVPAKLT